MTEPRPRGSESDRSRRGFRGRYLVYSVVVTALVLGGLNAVVEFLEGREVLDTRAPDDFVQLVDGSLLQPTADGMVRTTPYAERSVRPASFPADRDEGWRAMLLGGSFLMDKRGGIADWLRADLETRFPGDGGEVINFAAAGQDSFRNLRIAEQILPWGPDVLVLATCNNEGGPPPSRVREHLRELGGYRLLERLLAPTPTDDLRPAFTPQLAETDQVRRHFAGHIEGIVELAAQHGVPVLLATLPANLRYDGLDPHVPSSATPKQRRCIAEGVILVDGGRPDEAREVLSRCKEVDDAGAWLGLAELQSGGGDLGAEALRTRWGDCVFEGVELHYTGQHAEAVARLSRCDEVAEALRWIGLSRYAQGQIEAAELALRRSIDLLPRNRCRSSFNDEIRAIAQRHPHVELLDLDAVIRSNSESGLPGREWFVDTCHLNWMGNDLAARSLLDRLDALGWAPPGTGSVAPAPREELAQEWELPRIDAQGRRWERGAAHRATAPPDPAAPEP